MICRTHCTEQPITSAVTRLGGWLTAIRMIRALRLFTVLRLSFFRRRNLIFSYGRSGRTLTMSFMVHLQAAKPICSPLEVSYSNPLFAAARKSPYIKHLRRESCQLKTALERTTIASKRENLMNL